MITKKSLLKAEKALPYIEASSSAKMGLVFTLKQM